MKIDDSKLCFVSLLKGFWCSVHNFTPSSEIFFSYKEKEKMKRRGMSLGELLQSRPINSLLYNPVKTDLCQVKPVLM